MQFTEIIPHGLLVCKRDSDNNLSIERTGCTCKLHDRELGKSVDETSIMLCLQWSVLKPQESVAEDTN